MNEYQLPFKEGSNIAELGGGDRPLFHPNFDTRQLPTVDYVVDFNNLPLPIEDNSYDGIFSSYVLEHISWRNIKTFVSESFRILKPSSKAVYVTANLLNQCRRIVNTIDNDKKEWEEEFSSLIFGGQDYGENSHKVGFSPEYAIKLFKEAGFNKVEIFGHPQSNTDMIIQATKSSTNSSKITDAVFNDITNVNEDSNYSKNMIKLNIGCFNH